MTDQAQEVVSRLDTIISILQLAFSEQIEAALARVLADPVSATILELTAEQEVEAGRLYDQVAAATGQSKRTIQRRLATLLSQRAVLQAGSGPRVRYRRSGLI